jgi:hypothetical protein
MLLLPYVYHALGSFRHVFSRNSTWIVFCLVVLAFIGASDHVGVSSLCRFWQMDEAGYHRLLHLFRSSAWSVGALTAHWSAFALEQQVGVFVDGRLILHGDHTYGVKDGRRMPGVVTLHQHSETQSKPSYFRGHHWGIVGMMVGSLKEAFCLPLAAQIHQGFAHLGTESAEEAKKETLGLRLVQQALDFSVRHGVPSTLVLDAFFSTGPVFALAASVWSRATRAPYLHIITRAKKSYVAYFPAPKPRRKKPGKPAKYGRKIKLTDVFTVYKREFIKARCSVYGKEEVISYKALNLLWKPIKERVRFIFAITSRGPIVLMCSDLSIDSLSAIALYCSRVRIETLISVIKGLLGGFEYRFWSKRLPLHSRKPRKNAELKKPRPEHTETVRKAWEASERFVMLCCVALGLLQLLALKFGDGVWSRFHGFLRTRNRSTPSERTVRQVLCGELHRDMHRVPCSAEMQQIRPPELGSSKSIQIGQGLPPDKALAG